MAWETSTKYRLLLQVNNAIVKQVTREGLFQALAEEMRSVFHFDRFSINLFDPDTMSLSYFGTVDGIAPDGISQGRRPLHKGAIAAAVIRSRRPLVIPDLSERSYWESVRSMMAAGLSATMAFPLIVREQVIGSFHFSFFQAPSNLEDLVDFLTELSNQVAIAVDNMLAYNSLVASKESLQRQRDFLLSQSEGGQESEQFFYSGAAMTEVMGLVDVVARTDASVLITGETGTGKDEIARSIHHRSPRRQALFVKVNCPALAGTLFESELFGHAKGAFTGAHSSRVGRLEMADNGTLFLDEISELDVRFQAKLLQVLQEGVFERVGESRSREVDVRVIAATNRAVETCIREGTFRSDLYYRLNTVSIHVPALRERLEDIPALVVGMTAVQAKKMNRPAQRYASDCFDVMKRYSWPGNVRELKNLVKRLLILRPGEEIRGRDIQAFLSEGGVHQPEGLLTLADVERLHIEKVLLRTGGVVGGPHGAAALLGVPRSTLQYRMKKYGIRTTKHVSLSQSSSRPSKEELL